MSDRELFILGFIVGAIVSYLLSSFINRALDYQTMLRRARGRGYWKRVKLRREFGK